METVRKKLIMAMGELDDCAVIDAVRTMQANGCSQHEIVDCLNAGVAQVGERFEKGEYFIADLIVSGMIYRDVLQTVIPENGERSLVPKGRVVIGVVAGDIHDIGKDIMVSILRTDHFEVIDLGVDVTPERFAYAVRTYRPDVLLLSGVLTFAQESIYRTMELLKSENLKKDVPVCIGGLCANMQIMNAVGADGWAQDTTDTLNFCREVVRKKYGRTEGSSSVCGCL